MRDGDLEQYKAPSPRLFLPLILFEKMYVNIGMTARVVVKAGSADIAVPAQSALPVDPTSRGGGPVVATFCFCCR